MKTNMILTNKQIDRQQGISILRIVACLGVFIAHLGQRLHVSGLTETVFDYGVYGVELFFMLSGYLACLSWFRYPQKYYSIKGILKYYCKRCVRILPIYYICILFYFITETFIWKSIPADGFHLYWSRYIFLLNGIVPSDNEFWRNLGATWTIPIFMTFYLLFPLLVKLFKSFYKSCLLLVLTIAVRVCVERFGNGWFSALRYIPFFVFGMIVYFAVVENRKRTVLTFSTIGLIVCTLSFVDVIYQFVLIFIILLITLEDYSISNQVVSKVVATVDKYTYPWYLFHAVVFCGLIDKFSFSKPIIISVAVFGTLLLSVVISYFVERPIQKAMKRAFIGQAK